MIIITGGVGFIGSCLVKYLNELGIHDIIIVDCFDKTSKWKNLQGLSFRDIIHKDDLFDLWNKLPLIETVYHLGAISSTTINDGDLLFRNNYEYSKKICELAIKNKNTKFVYASSAATYGFGENGYNDVETGLVNLKPLNYYGYFKHLFDLFAQRHNLFETNKIIGLKYFNIFGCNENHKGDMRSIILKAYNQFKKDGKVNLFKSHRSDCEDGEQKRDFLYVKDAVKLTYYLKNHPNNIGGIFNIGSGISHSFNNLISTLGAAIDQKIPIEYINMSDVLKNKYQYFTKANIIKLQSTQTKKYTLPRLYSFKQAIDDYVNNYIIKGEFKINDVL